MKHKEILSHAVNGIRRAAVHMAAAERHGIHTSTADIAVKEKDGGTTLYRVIVMQLSNKMIK